MTCHYPDLVGASDWFQMARRDLLGGIPLKFEYLFIFILFTCQSKFPKYANANVVEMVKAMSVASLYHHVRQRNTGKSLCNN